MEEYKDLYYKEVEFNNRLNNKITTCITFLTVLGSALILLWTQFKNYNLCWYTIIYFIFCVVNTVMFGICIKMFIKSYSGYNRPTFPIERTAILITNTLNSVSESQKENVKNVLEMRLAERFINDAIENRKLNTIKSKRHNKMINMIIATFIVTFVSFAINISIDYYETKFINNNIQQVYIQGGEMNVR